MSDLALDATLDIMLLIFSALLLFIPLFRDLRTPIKKLYKGKWIDTNKKRLSQFGLVFIMVFVLSLGTGIWKAIRYDGATNKANGNLTQLQIEYSQLDSKYTATQAKLDNKNYNDSMIFKRIFDSLAANKIYLDANFKVVQHPRLIITNSDHITFGN